MRQKLILLLSVCFQILVLLQARRHKYKSCKRTAFNRRTTNYQAWREQMTVCDLLQEYDPAVRPTGRTPDHPDKGPVVITTSLDIRSISAVSEKNMEFVAQFRFRQEWYDDRLRFIEHAGFISPNYRSFEFIHVARDQTLWIPDTFFQNERKGWYHMLDQENRFLKIRSDGKLIYDRRLTLHLSCSMHLARYPMDTQNCEIAFASYAYTTDDIKYEWDMDAIRVHPGANGALPNFEIRRFNNGTCHSKTNTGEYSCLRVELRLRRVFSFFLLQLYIPSSMLVGVAWLSYWIDWKSTAARVPLAIITLLTMISTAHAVNANLPPVSYAKSIDIWVGACIVFIFFSLIEYAVVNYMGIMDEHRQMRKAACNRSRISNMIDTDMYMQSVDAMTSPTSQGGFSPQEKKVPAFSLQSRQPNTRTMPPKPQRRSKSVDPGQQDDSSMFRLLFTRGDLPVLLEHSGGPGEAPKTLRWAKHPQNMQPDTISYLIPKFALGLPIIDQPYRKVAEIGMNDLIDSAQDPNSIIICLPQLIRGIRASLYSFDSDKKKYALLLLTKLCRLPGVGEALVPFYRQLLPPLRKVGHAGVRSDISFSRGRQLDELVESTLNELERFGGNSAFINIKYVIPTYDSCLNINR